MSKRVSWGAVLVLAVGMMGCPGGGNLQPDGGEGVDAGSGPDAGGGRANQAPTWSALDAVVVQEGASTTVKLAAMDPDGDALTYAVVAGPAFATVAGDVLTVAPGQADVGDYLVTLSASDGQASVNTEVEVGIAAVNVAPVIAPIDDVGVSPGKTVTVTFNITDADGDSLTLRTTGLPAWATLEGSTLTVAPPADTMGAFPVTLTVSDGVETVSEDFSILSLAALNIGPVVVEVGQRDVDGGVLNAGVVLNAPPLLYTAGVDQDDDDVTFQVEVVPTGTPFTDTPTYMTAWTRAPLQPNPFPIPALPPGDYTWQLRWLDSDGAPSLWKPFSPGATSFTIAGAVAAPTATFSVNAGAAFTKDPQVTLNITPSVAATPAEMASSADASFAGAVFVPFATTATFTLPAGDGTKTVYGRFKDSQGALTLATDTIFLDTTAPAVTVSVNGGAQWTNSATASASITLVETGSGAASVCATSYATGSPVIGVPAANDPCFVPYTNPLSVNLKLDGERTVHVWVLDKAGNRGSGYDTIKLDTTPPDVPTGLTVTPGHRVLHLAYKRPADTGSLFKEYELEWCFGLLTCSSWEAFRVPPTFSGNITQDTYDFTVPNGRPVVFRIRAVDQAGNRGAPTAAATGAASWPFTVTQRSPSANNLNAVASLPVTVSGVTKTRTLVAGNHGELYSSEDFATFTRVDPMTDEPILALDTSSSYAWAVGGNGYIGRSADKGVTFSVHPTSVPVTKLLRGITFAGTKTAGLASTSAYVAVGDDGTILRSTRACTTGQLCVAVTPGPFSAVSNPATTDLYAVTRCSDGPIACATPGIVVAVGAGGKILRSGTFGETWAIMPAPVGYDTATFKAVVQVPGTDRLYAAGTKPTGRPALIVSTNGGTVWDAVTTPSFDDFTEITALAVPPKGSGASSTSLFVAGKKAAGAVVSQLVLGTSTLNAAPVGATVPRAILATAHAAGTWVGEDGAIQRSTALVVPSWTQVGGSQVTRLLNLDVPNISAPNAVVVGAGGTVLSTSDKGHSWSNASDAALAGLEVRGVMEDYLVTTADGRIFRNSNGWSPMTITSTPGTALNAVRCDLQSCYAVGDKETVLSLPNFTAPSPAWSVKNVDQASPVNYLDLVLDKDVNGLERIAIVGTGGKVRVFNGTSWSTPATGVTHALRAVARDAQAELLAVGGTVSGLTATPAILRSTNFGASWASVSTTGVTGVAMGVAHLGGDAWGVSTTSGRVFKSRDDGATWTPLLRIADSLFVTGGLGRMACDIRVSILGSQGDKACMVLGANGGVYVMVNDGE